jgi:hypothetical protein
VPPLAVNGVKLGIAVPTVRLCAVVFETALKLVLVGGVELPPPPPPHAVNRNNKPEPIRRNRNERIPAPSSFKFDSRDITFSKMGLNLRDFVVFTGKQFSGRICMQIKFE